MKKSRKLVLKKTTIRTLEGESLDRLAGGGTSSACLISIFRSVIGCDVVFHTQESCLA